MTGNTFGKIFPATSFSDFDISFLEGSVVVTLVFLKFVIIDFVAMLEALDKDLEEC